MITDVWFALLFIPVITGVDVDYLAPVLRTQSFKCQSILHQLYCHMKCNDKKAICVNENCFCVSDAVARQMTNRDDEDSEKTDGINDYSNSGDVDYEDKTRIDNIPFYAMRPTVRHHIAHFCPNLDVARECIKKCMTQGKPAFCGKDHVCYCGHKYSDTHDNSNVNVNEMYAQFQDLYTKYFGPEEDPSTDEEKSN